MNFKMKSRKGFVYTHFLFLFLLQEYSQTYLSRLNKSILTKESELLRLKSQTKCSKHDSAKLTEQVNHKQLLERLFGVKLCTKYSDVDTVTILVKTKQQVTKIDGKSDHENLQVQSKELLTERDGENNHESRSSSTESQRQDYLLEKESQDTNSDESIGVKVWHEDNSGDKENYVQLENKRGEAWTLLGNAGRTRFAEIRKTKQPKKSGKFGK